MARSVVDAQVDLRSSIRRRRGNCSRRWQWSFLLAMPSLGALAFVGERRRRPRRLCGTSKCNRCPMLSRFDPFRPRPPTASELFVSAEIEETARATAADGPSPAMSEHVWIWEDATSESVGRWKPPSSSSNGSSIGKHDASEVTLLISNWCEDFVSALDLCPWARASLRTPGAMRFFLVPPSREATEGIMLESDPYDEHRRRRMENIVDAVAERFQAEILSTDGGDENASSEASALENAAIYFVVFLPNDERAAKAQAAVLPESFYDFIDWFTELEEDWPEELDDVMVAPFHPAWEFGTADDSADHLEACLDYEKRSPYPLVTLVSTNVVDKAGATVTESIGEQNRRVLTEIETEQRKQQGSSGSKNKRSHANASVGELWRSAVYGDTAKKAKKRQLQ